MTTPYDIPATYSKIGGGFLNKFKYQEKKTTGYYDETTSHAFLNVKTDFGPEFPIEHLDVGTTKHYFRSPNGRAGWFTYWTGEAGHNLRVYHGDENYTIPLIGYNYYSVPHDVSGDGLRAALVINNDFIEGKIQFDPTGNFPVSVLMTRKFDFSARETDTYHIAPHFRGEDFNWYWYEAPMDILNADPRRPGGTCFPDQYNWIDTWEKNSMEVILGGDNGGAALFQASGYLATYVITGHTSVWDQSIGLFGGCRVDDSNAASWTYITFSDGKSMSKGGQGDTFWSAEQQEWLDAANITPYLVEFQSGCVNLVQKTYHSSWLPQVEIVIATLTPHGLVEHYNSLPPYDSATWVDNTNPLLSPSLRYSVNPADGEVRSRTGPNGNFRSIVEDL